uniref:TM6-like protein n=1 Tax=Balanophora laxiflora TaxID=1128103 RepID=K7R207_9MAGN|nr:TM6-like protein [Balanophora laxiflora]
MGRGKVEIKRIENSTNRQVTYSKRKNGIFKKAAELTVLCDARISLIMFSKSGKYNEYMSPTTTTKKIYDQYQKALDVDLWGSHYEKMQAELNKLKDINGKLRREIRQRIGEELEGLNIRELIDLEKKIDDSFDIVRKRKYEKLKTQTDITKKKINNLLQRRRKMLPHMNVDYEDPRYGIVVNEGDYVTSFGHNPSTSMYPFNMYVDNPGVYFGSPDLRLA